MNLWLIAALALLIGFLPCLWVLFRARTMERLVAMQMAGIQTPIILFLLAEGFGQPTFADLALAVALLSFAASLLFAHFFERWL